MLISRAISTFKLLKCANSIKNIRNMSGHVFAYRAATPPPPKSTVITANVIGGFMWWWILWHLWHEHEHITGEFPYPNPSEWTDEELGIPA